MPGPDSVLAYLRAVVAASECLVSEPDLQRGVDAALYALRQHTGLHRVFVFRDVPGSDGMVLYGESSHPCVPSIRELVGDRVFRDDAFPDVSPLLRGGRVYQSAHTQRRGENKDYNDAVATQSDLMVPVIVESRFWGIVGFDDCESEHPWNTDEIAALQGVASAIGAAVLRDAATRAQAAHTTAVAMRDRLLAAVAQSMQALLAGADRSFADAVRSTLGALGEACGIHRVKVIMQRPSPENGELTHFLDHEWWAPGLASQTSLGLTQFPNSLIPEWTAVLERGRALWYLIDDVPIQLRAAFEAVGVRSVGTVPIFGAGQYLGLIAFDDCVARRVWSDAEIDGLTAAARTIGAAIHQRQLQQVMLEERDLRIEAEQVRADESARHAARIERHSALLAAIATSAEELLALRDPGHCLDAVLQRIGQVTHALRACVARIDGLADDPNAHVWQEIVHEWSTPGALRQMDGPLRRFATTGARWQRALEQFATERRIVIAVADQDEPFRSERASLGVRWVLCYPLLVEGEAWGLLGLDYATRFEDFDESDLAAMQTLASTIADALSRQRLEQRTLQAERSRAAALRTANDELIASTSRLAALKDIPAFLDQLLLSMTRSCGARTGTLFAATEADGALRMRQCVMDDTILDIDTDERMRLWRKPLPAWIAKAWHERRGSEVVIRAPLNGVQSPDDWVDNVRWHSQFGHRLRLRFPLNVGGELLGIVVLSLIHDDPPDDFVLQQAVVLAQQAGIALQMERLAWRVEDSAVRAERNRMAAEIHDSLAQSFTSIAMQSESLAGLLAADPDKSRVLRLIERTAREGLAEARRSVLALLPADGWPGSLDQSLTALAERSSIRGGIECRFSSTGRPCDILGVVHESLLRIAQEATSNAMRHSGGTRVLIQLDYGSARLRLSIEDDGCGLPQLDGPRRSGGFGVSGMASRAAAIGGTLSLLSSALGGLAVTVELPCSPTGGAAA